MITRLRSGVVGLLLGSCVAFGAPPAPDYLKSQAEAAEKKADWDRALELYLKLQLDGSADVRDKVRECARRAAQGRRNRDAGIQQFVLSLPPADALNLYAEVLAKLHTHAADRIGVERLFEAGLDEFDRALGDAAFRARHLPEATPDQLRGMRDVLASWRSRLPSSAKQARQAGREIVFVAQRELAIANPSAVVLELICGACAGLDEYTVYLAPTLAQSELAGPILELAAYGILITYREGAVLVEGLVPDSWAAIHTTLRAGDRLLRANGRLLQTSPGTLAEALRMPNDAEHELETASGSFVRLPTPVPTVLRAEMLNAKDGVGIIRLGGLRATTPAEFDAAVARLRERGLRALILDLRGNAGGLFLSAVQVAQRVIPSGIIATTQGQTAEFANRVFSSDSGYAALDVPMVLLIDARTMSAAEVIAGALKDHNRATVVGMPTFGKGAIQYPFPLRSLDDAESPRSGVLIVTIARAFSPGGSPIHGVGVTPHVIEADAPRQMAIALERASALAQGR